MPKRRKRIDVTVEDIKKAEQNYIDTIFIFRTLSELLNEKGIKYEIEHDILNCSGNPGTPDFLIFLDENLTYVIEHKSSLNPSYGKNILQEIKDKYECIKYDETTYTPQIICLIPINLLKIMEDIRDKEKINIALSGFAINYDVSKITFEIHDELQNEEMSDILNRVISFNPMNYSEYRFIKAEPDYPTYTALILWLNVLLSLQDPYIGKKDYFEVNFDIISKRCSFFPSWIRNNEQLTNNRIKRGLEFLKKIGFIKWDGGRKDPIKVYYNKGTRVDDLREYFAKKFVEFYGKKEEREEKGGKIATLDSFIK